MPKKKKTLKLNLGQKTVKELMDCQNYIVKNGKESYLEKFEDMMENLINASEKIEKYVDDLLPDCLYCDVRTLSESDIIDFKKQDKKYEKLDMFYTSIDISALDGVVLGSIYFGIDRSVKEDGITIASIMNVDLSVEDEYKEEVDAMTECYHDKEKGILSILKCDDFVSYMVADNFAKNNYSDYMYIESLCEVGLPANFEITYENADEIQKKAKQRMELFSKRVSETTPYSVSSIKSDNQNLYIYFHEGTTDEIKFVYLIDLHSGESTININKTGNMSKSKMEKSVRRFRKYRDIAFLIDHVYHMFSVMAYCNSLKKTADTYVN